MIPKQTQPKLDALAEKYAQILLSSARAVFSRDEFMNTGELRDSLKVLVTPCTDTTAPKIVLTYADQGFYLGYKSPKWVRVPNIDKLREWAKTIEFSGPVPGYKDGSQLPPWKQKERIISAIAYNQRRNDAWKRKPWKNKSGINLGEMLTKLNTETIQAWVTEVETMLADAITTGTILS